MSWLDALRHRLTVQLRGQQYLDDQRREMELHLELDEAQLREHGAGEARRKFGNLTQVRERAREASGLAWIDGLRQDAGYALRGLRRAPAFTVMVVLTLGLGVGANAAMFSFLDRIYFRNPPGVIDPGEVRRIYIAEPDPFASVGAWRALQRFTYPQYIAIAQRLGDTVQIAADIDPSWTRYNGRRDGDPETAFVSGNYFALLGVRPAFGRFFAPDESHIDVDRRVAVITHNLWRSRFGSDSAIIGKTVEVFSKAYTIIGVTPPGFDGIDVATMELFLPLSAFPVSPSAQGPWYANTDDKWSPLRPIIRMNSGMRAEPLLAAATVAYREGSFAARARTDTARRLAAGPVIQARGPATVAKEIAVSTRMAGVTLLVLAIACANVMGLLLVRASARRREIAVRLALGVTRRRLLRQMLTESALLALIGSAAALFVAHWGGTVLRKLLLPDTVWAHTALEPRVIAFCIGTGLVVGLAAGIVPALRAMRTTVQQALKAGAFDGAHRSLMRSGLLAAQSAVSFVLLAAAGWFVRTYDNVHTMSLGFDAQQLVYARVTAPSALQPNVQAAFNEVAGRLPSMAGVYGTTLASNMQLNGGLYTSLAIPGRDSVKFSQRTYVAPSYFTVVKLTFREGRGFTRDEVTADPGPVVINEMLAKRAWPGESALGKCVLLNPNSDACSTVVGVVADLRERDIFETKTAAHVFVPTNDARGQPTVLIARVDPRFATEVMHRMEQDLQKLLPASARVRAASLAKTLEPQYRPWLVGAKIFSAFGILALIVAAVGVYTVVAYSVSQRRHEMGVRIALGARVRDMLDLIVGEGMRTVALGMAAGLVLTFLVGRLVSAYLFGITTRDPFVLMGAAAVLTGAALLASLAPAWRAARVDAMTSLRTE